MKKGLFIVFEGGEGTGKTTAIESIYDWIQEKDLKCIKTREPGGIKISEEIRQVILDKDNTKMDGRTEALLYAAARRQHLVEKVIPALNEGYVVLCDRFIDSSLAYQGFARGLGIDEVMSINKFAIIGLERISTSGEREINRLDLEKIDFHEKVREGYNKVYKENRHRIVKINAEQSKENVLKEIKKILENKFFQL